MRRVCDRRTSYSCATISMNLFFSRPLTCVEREHLDLTTRSMSIVNVPSRSNHSSTSNNMTSQSKSTALSLTSRGPRTSLYSPTYEHSTGSVQTGKSTERQRTFVHQSNSRPFVLGAAIQMKPLSNNTCQTSDRCSRSSTSIYNERNSLCQQVNKQRSILSSGLTSQSLTCDTHIEQRRLWTVREKARLFEHTASQTLSTGRENYV
jgi:hypothetical protein